MFLRMAASDRICDVFAALANPVRRQLLEILTHQSLSAGELSARFELSRPAVAEHLKVLRDAGLLTSQRRASWVYYAVVPEALRGLSALLSVDAIDAPA